MHLGTQFSVAFFYCLLHSSIISLSLVSYHPLIALFPFLVATLAYVGLRESSMTLSSMSSGSCLAPASTFGTNQYDIANQLTVCNS
jgi:hypothetical protein